MLKLIIIHNTSLISAYKSQILDCFKSKDTTIRKQALWLLSSLATEANIKEIVGLILEKTGNDVDDLAFRHVQVKNIIEVQERGLVPETEKEWYLSVLLELSQRKLQYKTEKMLADVISKWF